MPIEVQRAIKSYRATGVGTPEQIVFDDRLSANIKLIDIALAAERRPAPPAPPVDLTVNLANFVGPDRFRQQLAAISGVPIPDTE